MIRSIAILAIACLASSVSANIPVLPLQAGAPKKADPTSPAEARKKLIEEIQADYQKVQDQLDQADPGGDTRSRQKRIIDGIDKLLDQQDPDAKAGNDSSPPSKPPGGADPRPKPKPGSSGPTNPPPQAEQQPKPLARPVQAIPAKTPPSGTASNGQRTKEPNTPAEVLKAAGNNAGRWELPARHRQAMDAAGREQFMLRYEEMLRAYYRNIAESSRE